MNSTHAALVPPFHPVEAISSVLAVDLDSLHQGLIRGSTDMAEACLEDLSDESLNEVERLFEKFRIDLRAARAAVNGGAPA